MSCNGFCALVQKALTVLNAFRLATGEHARRVSVWPGAHAGCGTFSVGAATAGPAATQLPSPCSGASSRIELETHHFAVKSLRSTVCQALDETISNIDVGDWERDKLI